MNKFQYMGIDIQLRYHKETDANNRWEACNQYTHSNGRKKAISDNLYKTIAGKERQAVLDIILQHIDKEFGDIDMETYEQKISQALEKNKEQYIATMEQLTKHPIPYEKIICYITTLPRCPYHREKGLIRMYYKADNPVGVFLHETLHFQFHWRYRNHPKVKLLSLQQFDALKESLTFLLNHEFKEFIERPDLGYPQHQELRKKLENYRTSQPKKHRDFDTLIDYACDALSTNNISSL